MSAVLLCSDLDRTLLPNGAEPESPGARDHLARFAAHEQVTLAYVSGRHEALLKEAIQTWSIPVPDFAVGDVGTTIYEIRDGQWQPWQQWADHIAPDWAGADHADLVALFQDLEPLRLQETAKQNTFKLSYYTAVDLARAELLAEMESRLAGKGVKASLIWSVDEEANVGLLDVLPASATKLHAVQFLREALGMSIEQTVFSGDSGNDLPVVSSGELQSVLVKNAHPEVIAEAEAALKQRGCPERLYVAQGHFLDLNGNYSAGVLEGVAHYLPHTIDWMQ